MKDNPKRAQILKAATECFTRFGFDKTTLEDIGARAGLNKASLYYYFKNKEEIFAAVVLDRTNGFMSELQTRLASYPDLRRQIRFFLTERIRRDADWMHLVQPGADRLQKIEPIFESVYRESREIEMNFLTGLLRRAAQDNNLVLNMPSIQLAEHLFRLSEAFRHEAMHTGSEEQIFAAAIEEMEFWIKLLLR